MIIGQFDLSKIPNPEPIKSVEELADQQLEELCEFSRKVEQLLAAKKDVWLSRWAQLYHEKNNRNLRAKIRAEIRAEMNADNGPITSTTEHPANE